MAFRFKLGEPFDEGCRRISVEQIDRAQDVLRGSCGEALAVHETRKSLKRLRALLRLIRPAIGEETFKAENHELRDIGLSLAGARDRYVLGETLNKLLSDSNLSPKSAEALRKRLGPPDGHGTPLAMDAAHERLAAARERLGTLPIEGSDFDVVGRGLERSYRRARRAFADAYRAPGDEAFHEWRKGAQAHWRQMLLLSRAWPDYLGARAAEARTLSQILGDDHDLALLAEFARSQAEAVSEPAEQVQAAARNRQAELRQMARPRGERLFAASPKHLRRSVGIFWRSAEALKDVEPEAVGAVTSGPQGRVRQGGRRQRSEVAAKA
ncbi:MAG TPA: CHAD domain-containing protein [Hyphomicrobium sp.]|nr:CHAD domain-containing protein [Hyphomicrobium sp.]